MKKLLALLTMLIVTLNFSLATPVVADTQIKVIVDTLVADTQIKVTEAERIIDKYAEKTFEGFNEVVKTITPTAKEGFKIVVKKNIAIGIVYLFPLILVVIFFKLLVKEYKDITKIINGDNVPYHMSNVHGPLNEHNISFLLVTYIILFTISALITIFTFDIAITHLIAPEWYAIKDIIELFKP